MSGTVELSREQASEWLAGVLCKHFEVSPERIHPNADLHLDMDLDSIDAADIVLMFNETFHRDIDMRAFRAVRTFAQALDLLGR